MTTKLPVWASPVLHCPQNTKTSPDKKDNGSTPAAVFFTRTFRFSALALALNVSIEPKSGRLDMGSLVHSHEHTKATTLFVSTFGVDLVAEV